MVTDCKDCYGSGEVPDSYDLKKGKGDKCPTCNGTGKIKVKK
jgi:DnaJ-class molecular chaperone